MIDNELRAKIQASPEYEEIRASIAMSAPSFMHDWPSSAIDTLALVTYEHRRERRILKADIVHAETQRDQAQEAWKNMRHALIRWGEHDIRCLNWGPGPAHRPCTCGLDKAIGAGEGLFTPSLTDNVRKDGRAPYWAIMMAGGFFGAALLAAAHYFGIPIPAVGAVILFIACFWIAGIWLEGREPRDVR